MPKINNTCPLPPNIPSVFNFSVGWCCLWIIIQIRIFILSTLSLKVSFICNFYFCLSPRPPLTIYLLRTQIPVMRVSCCLHNADFIPIVCSTYLSAFFRSCKFYLFLGNFFLLDCAIKGSSVLPQEIHKA